MKYKGLIVLLWIVLAGSIALRGQTGLKEKDCNEVWELSCEKATELLKMEAQFPLQIQKIGLLTQQLAEKQIAQQKQEKKLKRRRKINKIVVLVAFIGGVLI